MSVQGHERLISNRA